MSIDTERSAIGPGSDARVRWAGRILLLLGTGHLVLALALTIDAHADRWFTAQLWRLDEGILNMSPAMAAFWLTTGSFAGPLIMVGVLVLWLDRQGIAPPRSVAWMLVIWSALAAVIVEPAPWVLITVAGGLLLAARRRTALAADSGPAR